MKNIKGLELHNKQKADEARNRVLDAIDSCKKEGNLSISHICKVAGVSKSYFSKHEDIRKVLNDAGGGNNKLKKRKQSLDSREAIIIAKAEKIGQLERQLRHEESWEEKHKRLSKRFDELVAENASLKEKLEKANRQNGLLDF